jgi:hypothetical protein
MLDDFLQSGKFYFSSEFDLTQSLQRQSNFTKEEKLLPIWKRVFNL